MASALGLPPKDFGAKCWRIGGATDLREQLGTTLAERSIKERGRWNSDIGRIYARALIRTMLDASADISRDDVSRDLEALRDDWVQPSSFR